jgi:hypothetical protein
MRGLRVRIPPWIVLFVLFCAFEIGTRNALFFLCVGWLDEVWIGVDIERTFRRKSTEAQVNDRPFLVFPAAS